MDHEVVPRLCKICDWLLKLSWDHFGLNHGKVVRVTMEFEVPKWPNFKPTLSTLMVQWVLQWEKQKRCSNSKRQGCMAKKCWYNHFFGWNLFWGEEKMKTREDKRMVKLDFFSQNCLFGAYIKNINTFTFWCMVIPLGPHLVYTQWRAQKLCKLVF